MSLILGALLLLLGAAILRLGAGVNTCAAPGQLLAGFKHCVAGIVLCIAGLMLLLLPLANASETPPSKPGGKPEVARPEGNQSYVMMPENLWLQALEVMRAQQDEIARLRAYVLKSNTCGGRI